MMHESQLHAANSFLTLTYATEHLPADGSLDVKHWQLFAKRLRAKLGKFRFYHCGEYGGKFGRPHYHAALFGMDFAERRVQCDQKDGLPVFRSPELDEIWGKGSVYIGTLTWESAAYVANYVTKQITGDQAEEHYRGRKPEYATMSRRPGIGAGWIEKFHRDVYPRDEVITRGFQVKPPSYYDDVMTEKDPVMMEGVKAKRMKESRKHREDSTWQRLRVKEKCMRAKIRLTEDRRRG